MDNLLFDAIARHAAGAASRRALLGLLGGSALMAIDPLAAAAKKGGKGKKKKKNKGCDNKANRDSCNSNFFNYCSIAYDGADFNSCSEAFHHCCGFWCTDHDKVVPCAEAVPW